MDLDLLSGSINPKLALDCFRYKHKFRKDNPEYFDPERIACVLWWTRFSVKLYLLCNM